MSDALLERLRAALSAAGDPARAAAQQAYMKSPMPFHGVDATGCRAICKATFASYGFDDAAAWRADVLAIWRGATHREERYAAIELASSPRARPLQGLAAGRSGRGRLLGDAATNAREALALYEDMVVEGAWWDLVDPIATHLVGDLFAPHASMLREAMIAWSDGTNLWMRRSAIICQVRRAQATDRELLEHTIRAAVDDRTFWLRKAIGWALRAYARTDPEWVRAEVDALGDRLSGLSRREALKHLGTG